jgi:hypothetical protein
VRTTQPAQIREVKAVKVELYNYAVSRGVTRRGLLRGAAGVGAMAAMGAIPGTARPAWAQDNVRAEILKIPGVGMGSPTDADWQRVGELCLGPTRERVAEGEFAGVELTFMGLNNQNLHNFLFRGFLKPWEAYTGATINWIDLAQADYNARLQQSIATGTVDFDIIEMGAPFEGDTAGRGLLDEMPEWVSEQIDETDLVGYLQPPSAPGTARSTASPSTATPIPSPTGPTTSARAPSAGPRFPRPGKRSTPCRRRSPARPTRSPACPRMAISTRSRAGAASASTSSRTAPRPM